MTTLAQLVGQVRRTLADFNERGAATATGDGTQTVWNLPDRNIVGNDTILAATALTAAEQTITDEIVDLPFYSVVRVEGNAAGIAGDVVVNGLSWDNSTATDTIALNGTTVVSGTTKFKGTPTSIVLPVLTHAADTVKVTSGTSIVCTVATVSNTAWVCDYETGWLEFTAAPADAAEVLWSYYFSHFSHDDIVTAVNYGLDRLYPYFYVTDLDTTVSTTSDTYEYTLPDCEEVIGMEWRSSSDYPWKRFKQRRYEVVKHGTTKYLKLHDNPPTGSIRLQLVQRPESFTADSDTLTDLGLPERAAGPLVTYACWWLINTHLAKRARSDVAIANQAEGSVTVYEMQRATAAFALAFETELQMKRMSPWSAR